MRTCTAIPHGPLRCLASCEKHLEGAPLVESSLPQLEGCATDTKVGGNGHDERGRGCARRTRANSLDVSGRKFADDENISIVDMSIPNEAASCNLGGCLPGCCWCRRPWKTGPWSGSIWLRLAPLGSRKGQKNENLKAQETPLTVLGARLEPRAGPFTS